MVALSGQRTLRYLIRNGPVFNSCSSFFLSVLFALFLRPFLSSLLGIPFNRLHAFICFLLDCSILLVL